MVGFPNSQSNPASACPVWIAPPPGAATAPITTDANTQIKTGSGVFLGLTVATGGTASSAAMYDGTSSVVTMTIATPGVVSWVGHPFAAGDAVKFTTTGALPTGLTANTTYYVSTAGLTADAFQVADTKAHALAGTNSVATSGSQSGVQHAWDVTVSLGTYDTTAAEALTLPAGGMPFADGLIGITASGGAANLVVSYL